MAGLGARGGGGGSPGTEVRKRAEEPSLRQAAGLRAAPRRRRGGRGVSSATCARSQSAATQPSARKLGHASVRAPSAQRK